MQNNSTEQNNSIVVDSFQDGPDCRETYFTEYAGQRVYLAFESLSSVHTRRHIVKVAKQKFGEDVKIEFICHLETQEEWDEARRVKTQ